MFSAEEKVFLASIGLKYDFDKLTDDDLCEIEESVGDFLTTQCLDRDYMPDHRGKLCERILDKLGQS